MSGMKNPVIIDAIRTSIGVLASVCPDDLAAHVIKDAQTNAQIAHPHRATILDRVRGVVVFMG